LTAVFENLTVQNPAELSLLSADYALGESFDEPAMPGGAGGRTTRNLSRAAPLPATAGRPGPAALRAISMVSLQSFLDAHAMPEFCAFIGACGAMHTRQLRVDEGFVLQALAGQLAGILTSPQYGASTAGRAGAPS